MSLDSNEPSAAVSGKELGDSGSIAMSLIASRNGNGGAKPQWTVVNLASSCGLPIEAVLNLSNVRSHTD
jgi:hypothetical protein